jgi:lipopolysaccharide transport system permease protein
MSDACALVVVDAARSATARRITRVREAEVHVSTDVDERRTPDEFVFDATNRVSFVRAIRELIAYRETVWSFGVRSFRVRYKQAVLGVAWALLQPLAFLGVFVLLFGGVADIGGGGATYAAFALSALVPWTFVSSGVQFGGDSLIQDAGLVRKVYFPREAPVLGVIGSYIPDFVIGIGVFLLLSPLTGATLTWNLLYVPLLFVAVAIPAIAVSIPLAGLAVYYRDFKYALPFAIQVWLFASPVAYPITVVDPEWRWLYALLNPVVGMLEGFRLVLAVGAGPDWGLLGLSLLSSFVLLTAGFRVFKRLEREFADVI